jgi:hypothetical protein
MEIKEIDENQAKELVLKHINDNYDQDGGVAGGLDTRKIITHNDDGWIFFYDTKKSIDTGNWRYSLAGNHPIFVFKDSGKMYSIYPDIDEEEIIRRHRKDYPSHSLDDCPPMMDTCLPHQQVA